MMAAKSLSKREQEAAKLQAKKNVAARKAEQAAKMDAPLEGDELIAAVEEALGGKLVQFDERGDGVVIYEVEGTELKGTLLELNELRLTGKKDEGTGTSDEIASIAAKGLRDGGSLSDEEVQRVSASALSQADDVDADEAQADGQADFPGEAFPDVFARLLAVESRCSELERVLFGLIDELEKRQRKFDMAMAKAKIKTQNGIDGLGKIEDL